MESGGEFRGEALAPGGANEADVDQVQQMDLIFEAERGELHLDEGIERGDAELGAGFGFGHLWRGQRVIGPDELTGEDDADRALGTIEKEIDAADVLMDESSIDGDLDNTRKVFAADEDVDDFCVADRFEINTGHPGGDGVFTDTACETPAF